MSKLPSSFLPPGMDGRQRHVANGHDNALEEWQRNTSQTINRSLDPETTGSRARTIGDTIRAVSPEPNDEELEDSRSRTPTRTTGPFETPASPRSIPGGEKPRDRRQGLVFDDRFDASSDSSPTQPLRSPPDRNNSPTHQPSSRPRTRTLDDNRSRQTSSTVSRSRHRIGSVHSTVALAWDGHNSTSPHESTNSQSFSSPVSAKPAGLQKSTSIKEKSGKRLQKKGSRPTSPLASPTPSADSLPVPLATSDANKILKLMKTLNGRMRGALEYQTASTDPWVSGLCYVDENRGSLMCEGEDRGPFHSVVLPDLRGCRVRPTKSAERHSKCLEIISTDGLKARLIPLLSTEFDHWLAAILFWQQTRVGGSQINLSIPEAFEERPERPDKLSRTVSSKSLKEASIIKVGKALLWDKGKSMIVTSNGTNRVSNKDHPAQVTSGSWQRVSCVLQDNGEFKLHSESGAVLVSVIQLSQLSRFAVQRLDRSVLGEEYCIAIFPQYTSTSTTISIIRPVYIALDQRVYFEVWFVLLRAFAIPEIYGPRSLESEDEASDLEGSDDFNSSNDMFRIYKSLAVRVIEAKVRKATKPEIFLTQKHDSKTGQDPLTGDYFVEVILDGELRGRTTVKQNTKNPFWREDYDFQDLPASLPALSILLKRKVPIYDNHHGQRNDRPADHSVDVLCGVINVRLGEQLEKGKDDDKWWPILDEQNDQIGEMFLKIRHEETVVLLARDYQHISELLHRFSNGLTMQIAQTAPANLRHLSEIFMNIFQVSGQAHNWLMALVEDEIDGVGREQSASVRYRFSKRIGSNDSYDSVSERELSVRDMSKSLTGEANLLFRGNSLLTQSLDFHMRRAGKEYLEEVLRENIEEINALDPNCEVDPSRLAHGDDISKNWAQLISLTTKVWESISTSANKCPAALRHILKFIRAVADDRYGDFLRTVPYTSVSGFLFLRFFCPSILNPKLFDLLRDHPKPRAQRTLTLIAKSLQVLANLSTFGQKEAWMEPMNRFLSTHRQQLKSFIDNITSIPLPSDRANLTVPASYSTPITILGRLPPTSREGFPSLPYLIDHASNFAALIKLWLQSTEGQVRLSALTGDLATFHDLCVALQRKTDDCLHNAEAHAQETLDSMASSLHWDDLVPAIDHQEMRPLEIAHTLQPSPIAPDSKPASTMSGASVVHFSPITQTPFLPINQMGTSMTSLSSIATPRPPGSSSSTEGFNSHHSRASSKKGISRAGSESEKDKKDKEKKERQSFWESTFGKESRYQRPYGGVADPGEGSYKSTKSGLSSSPPSRGVSRHGEKREKERKKEEREREKELKREEKERSRASGDLKRDKSGASSSNKHTDKQQQQSEKEREKEREKEKSTKDGKDKGFLGLSIRKKPDNKEEKDREKKSKISGPLEASSGGSGKEERRHKQRKGSLALGAGWNGGESGGGDGGMI